MRTFTPSSNLNNLNNETQTPTTMNTDSITIYTNGTSLFTLENYSPAAGVCHVNGIAIHATVTTLEKRAMHSNGALHYVYGIGDTVALKGASLKRGAKSGSFEVH